ncbi:MAG: KH domain-containing protein [Thermoplasmatota archaeon]
MKYIKIPKQRIGVLIGQNGETKKEIETRSKTNLLINSEEGEITIDDHQSPEPLLSYIVEDVIRAIGRGFSPEHALQLFHEDLEFFLFNLHDYIGKKNTHIRRIKSRVIGTEGKTKRTLEHLTSSHISIYGHTIGIIADFQTMDILKKAIDMLITGSKHASVYRYIEREMKKIRLQGLQF